MPGLQSRVSCRRRHGQIQERVSRRLLVPSWHRVRRAGAGQRPHRRQVGQPPRTALELADRVLQTDHRTPARHRSPTRTCRAFSRRPLSQRAPTFDGNSQAVLFSDTFTNYYEPSIGLAALEVLAAAGISAGLAGNGCCGQAADLRRVSCKTPHGSRRANAERLYPHAAAGRPIVFCEPSCLSAVREDAPSLLRGDARRKAEAVANATVLFEEFAGTIVSRLTLSPGPATILLHGHCHQKSMGLVPSAKDLLSKIPGTTVIGARRRLLRHGRVVGIRTRPLRPLARHR